ncbi:C40 family peptidase [Arthrobacter sp. SDTb3-6]|uniref:C40 family peptidase n=1 Tax=Arthrobacter sp. SDTb3-6 TaxID=2713571 RepID=UPI00159D92BE|nr:C40 family peptidase [Arthrobacter sp. SDTb3-6]NVM98411.1 C40 family peptidase [Arthrobacter sp. SDTb3-6]
MPAAALATIAKARLIQRALAALVVVVPVGMAALLGGTSILVAQIAGTSTSCTSAPQESATTSNTSQPAAQLSEGVGSLTVPGPNGAALTLDSQQQVVAGNYISVGQSLGVSAKGIQIAIMVALQESGLRMLANPAVPESLGMPHDGLGYDHDSLGSAQQRSSAGWGTVLQLMTPAYDAEAFFGGPRGPNNGSPPGLLDIPGWESMGLGQAAQAVQVSAFPELYDRWAPAALAIMDSVNGTDLPQNCSQAGPTEDPSASQIPANLSATRQAVLRYAQEGVGGSYVWGGTAFKAWDCSGYVQWIYAQVGIVLPRTEQWLAGRPTAAPQPGDLVVQGPDGPNHWGHVGIYAGAGMMYSALNPSAGTLLHPVSWNPGAQYFDLLGPAPTN